MRPVPPSSNAGFGPRFFVAAALFALTAARAQVSVPAPPAARISAADLAGRIDAPALALYRAGDYAGALAAADAVLAVRTNDTAHLFFRAGILAEQGRLPEAVTGYRAVLQREPDWIAARNALGEILYRTGDFAAALAVYQRTRELDPADPMARYMTFICLLLDGRQAEADALRVETALSRETPEFHLMHAAHLFRTGKPDRAAYLHGAALRMYPAEVIGPYLRPFADQGWVAP